ncbi:hypothetical protein [Kitasatospora indigofera]|uniref:hypothetical protein n=1 Tax=Kitasatospora indigofera TaxID=67307 RepID=UPI0036D171D3
MTCLSCGEPYQQTGRGNGGWFHFKVVAKHCLPDGRTQFTGHWRAGDWTDGMVLVLRSPDGRRSAVIGAEMEPPLNSVCEARGQRVLTVPEFGPLTSAGCIHAAR